MRRIRRLPVIALLLIALFLLYRRLSSSHTPAFDGPFTDARTQSRGKQSADNGAVKKPDVPEADPKSLRKMIVMAKTAFEDTRWVSDELPDWNASIYSWDDLSGTTIPLMNDKGREANAYLTYLIDHYDDLADIVVFLHAHRGGNPRGWHIDNEDFDNALSVKRLRLEAVRKEGYVNLRCQFLPGCPIMFDTKAKEDPEESPNIYLDAFKESWPALFPKEPIPETLGVACCAQFAVSKAQIRKRPRSDYERYKTWLLETRYDDHLAGTVLEYLWHVIFGRDPVHCPDIWECYCEVFGEDCYVIEDLDGVDAILNDLKRKEDYT
jgi:Protein of unknown function (DUF3431)